MAHIADGYVDTPNVDAVVARPRRRMAIIALLVGALPLAVGLGLIQAWPTRYAATSVVSFTPRPAAMAPADTLQLVGQKYVVIATSRATMQAASDTLGLNADDLAAGTVAALSPASVNLEIVVELPDREQAVAAANTVAALVVERAANDELIKVEQTSSAVAIEAVAKPPRGLLRAVSGVAAALLAGLVWTVLRGRSRVGPAVPPARPAVGVEVPPLARRPATRE
jgi:hypothetical protein